MRPWRGDSAEVLSSARSQEASRTRAAVRWGLKSSVLVGEMPRLGRPGGGSLTERLSCRNNAWSVRLADRHTHGAAVKYFTRPPPFIPGVSARLHAAVTATHSSHRRSHIHLVGHTRSRDCVAGVVSPTMYLVYFHYLGVASSSCFVARPMFLRRFSVVAIEAWLASRARIGASSGLSLWPFRASGVFALLHAKPPPSTHFNPFSPPVARLARILTRTLSFLPTSPRSLLSIPNQHPDRSGARGLSRKSGKRKRRGRETAGSTRREKPPTSLLWIDWASDRGSLHTRSGSHVLPPPSTDRARELDQGTHA